MISQQGQLKGLSIVTFSRCTQVTNPWKNESCEFILIGALKLQEIQNWFIKLSTCDRNLLLLHVHSIRINKGENFGIASYKKKVINIIQGLRKIWINITHLKLHKKSRWLKIERNNYM